MLTDAQIERYSRQIILPEVGGRGQTRLLDASAAVVGDGHLAAVAVLYLAAAGVGRLAIAEPQAAAVADLNPDCQIDVLRPDALGETVAKSGIVVCADVDDVIRRAVHRACRAAQRPMIWGYADGARGAMTTFAGERSGAPCADCLVDQVISAPHAGVELAELTVTTAGFVGTLLATAALKMFLGLETMGADRVVLYDARGGAVSEAAVVARTDCVACRALTESPRPARHA